MEIVTESLHMSRPYTWPAKRVVGIDERASPGELAYLDATSRPETRGECMDEPRPCPWISCRHHLYAEVTSQGSLRITFPDKELHELDETCALDVADRDGATLQEVGEITGLTRERIRQIEVKSLRKLKDVGLPSLDE